ncbi:hypothetical protein [Thermofilum pendens]|uniref:Transcriptional regulator n=1 Tax=Thermofilum pendens (strain DSM 2475 / Hrk 5) TaxID=368408 RepID=A1RWG4_THEPD|nr:hypothetical protein [Thermofilum pendens]ABL77544.1 hypothetical protein Tpen_0134 [Thermofilum pendens Hrk 5]
MAEYIRLAKLLRELESLAPECRAFFRVLSLFLENPDEAFTKYRVEKETALSHVARVLERMVSMGVLEIVDENPRLYRLNKQSPFLQHLLEPLVKA